MIFHAAVVFGLDKDLSFKSVLEYCGMVVLNLNCAKNMSKLCHFCIQDVGLTKCIRNYVTKIQNRILELH